MKKRSNPKDYHKRLQ